MRVAIVYLIILIAMRFMGKRMVAEVGRADIVARVSLAAAIGLPIQRPGRGLLVALVIVAVIVGVGRLLAWMAFKNKTFEKTFQGNYAPLVADGVIDRQRLNKVRITKERLFAALRAENIRHLGEVERLYMEANGEFSLVEKKGSEPGLSVIPQWDGELRDRQQRTGILLCKECGSIWKEGAGGCFHCGGKEQEAAVISQPG